VTPKHVLCAVSVWIWAGLAQANPLPADADVTLSPDGMRSLSAGLIQSGRLAEAAALTDALIARDPSDPTALILRARVALATDDPRGAIALAARAFRAGGNDDQRYAAARIAARGHAALKQDTRAQWWLRRAGNVAPDEAAERSVAEEFRALRQRNPLAISLQFGISPSSNINGGSANDSIILPGLPVEFVLDGEARPLSGLQIEAGFNLSYRLHRTENTATFFDASLQGRTYILSAQAREQAPDARGSNYADVSPTISLTHRWLPDGARGPWTLTGTYGHTWYEDSLFAVFGQFSLGKSMQFEDGQRLDLSAYADLQDRIRDNEYLTALGARGRWTWITSQGDQASISMAWRDTLGDLADVAFNSALVGAGYQFAQPVASIRLGLGADLEYRYFPTSNFALDGREDWRGNLRVMIGLPDYSYYGFEPQVILRASHTESSVALYDSRSLSIDFGIVSSF
jgi:hypothetical protein